MLCSCHWSFYDQAANAADDILSDVFSLRSARKDQRDFLTRRGFERVLRDLTAQLIRTSTPADERALRTALQALDTDWRGISQATREAAIERAARALGGVPNVVVQPVVSILSQVGQSIVTGTKQQSAGLYDLPIGADFNGVDRRVVDHAAQSHAFYVRDEYGKRQDLASQRAREIVSAGVEAGFDRYEIGKRLASAMAALSVQRSEHYWPMVASVFSARSRSWGTLSSFQEAGIEQYEISATLDGVTCSACRLMHERAFSTRSAVTRFQQVADSDAPEAVRDLMPFLGVARNDQGQEAVYFKRGDQRHAVAQVLESGVGRDNAIGKYGSVMSAGAMQTAGVSCPPFHPHCRCLQVPTDASLVQVPVQVDAPAPLPVSDPVPAPPPVPVQQTPPPPVEPAVRQVETVPTSGYASGLRGIKVQNDLADGSRSKAPSVTDAVMRAVFGEQAPSIAALQEMWGHAEGGFGTIIKEIQTYTEERDGEVKTSVIFAGNITRNGKKIGDVARTFVRHPSGELEAHHDLFRIDSKANAQGKGLGEAMLRQAIQSYEQLGVNKITVDSAWVGKYTWASFGYNWDAEAAAARVAPLAAFLVENGVDAARAADIAQGVTRFAWDVAALDVDGKKAKVTVEEVEREEKLGKAFMLSYRGWHGELVLDPTHPTYQRAKKRLGL